ncbi:MAG: hypothetical protein HZC51_06115 [Nitrospirae bacterium]|nr:hypothetical protein [Nitrospirota bacterium]
MDGKRHGHTALEKAGKEGRSQRQAGPHEMEGIVMGVRTKRRIIAFCYNVGIVTVCLLMAKAGLALDRCSLLEVSGAVFIGHILTFRVIPVSRWLQEALIPEAVCFGCGTPVELVGQFRCGCGFVPYKERHAFSPCPMCGKLFSWVVCPSCETSILV